MERIEKVRLLTGQNHLTGDDSIADFGLRLPGVSKQRSKFSA
jgi:hypothetical protein